MKQRVVIIGGGFGGLYTALELEKRLGADSGAEVTLVNRDNFFLFTPMLHEVAASDLDLTTIVDPIRKMLRRTNFFNGAVRSIDLEKKQVTVSHGRRSAIVLLCRTRQRNVPVRQRRSMPCDKARCLDEISSQR